MAERCAPHKKRFYEYGKSCLSTKDLRAIMKKVYNLTHDVDYSPYTRRGGANHRNDHTTKTGLKRTLAQLFKEDDEYLWANFRVDGADELVDQIVGRDGILYEKIIHSFKPYVSKDFSSCWLSQSQIEQIIAQVTVRRRLFRFVGVWDANYPNFDRDIRDTIGLTHKMQSGRVRLKYSYYGIVWNKGGNHWVAAFVDRPTREIDYFDSFANKPPQPAFRKLVNTFEDHDGEKYKQNINNIAHQKGDGTQCGMYAIHFILERVRGVTMKEMNKKTITPASMKTLRKAYFHEMSDYQQRRKTTYQKAKAGKYKNVKKLPSGTVIDLLDD
jgi:hypothetical protein